MTVCLLYPILFIISRRYLLLILLSYKCATCRRGSVQCKSTSRPDPFYFLFCLLGGWAPGLARPSQPGSAGESYRCTLGIMGGYSHSQRIRDLDLLENKTIFHASTTRS